MPARSSCRRCSRPASGTIRTARRRCAASRSAPKCCAGLSLVVPKAVHKAGFHPTAVFGAMGAAAGVAAALKLDREANRRCARHRRQHGERHHRVSRRGRLDQAHACRLGGAVRPARRPDGARGLFRAAHRVRRHARAVPRLRAQDRWKLRCAARRFRHALGHRDARLQALSVRDDDASLHRLRAAARGARHQAGGHRGHRLRRRRGHGASAVGAARRQAEAGERLRGQILAAAIASRPRWCAAMWASATSPTRR